MLIPLENHSIHQQQKGHLKHAREPPKIRCDRWCLVYEPVRDRVTGLFLHPALTQHSYIGVHLASTTLFFEFRAPRTSSLVVSSPSTPK